MTKALWLFLLMNCWAATCGPLDWMRPLNLLMVVLLATELSKKDDDE